MTENPAPLTPYEQWSLWVIAFSISGVFFICLTWHLEGRYFAAQAAELFEQLAWIIVTLYLLKTITLKIK